MQEERPVSSSSLVAHVLHYPLPPREQLCDRSCGNEHTHSIGVWTRTKVCWSAERIHPEEEEERHRQRQRNARAHTHTHTHTLSLSLSFTATGIHGTGEHDVCGTSGVLLVDFRRRGAFSIHPALNPKLNRYSNREPNPFINRVPFVTRYTCMYFIINMFFLHTTHVCFFYIKISICLYTHRCVRARHLWGLR